MNRRYDFVPLWVDCAFQVMEKADRFISAIPDWLGLNRRFGLIDKYCQCEYCLSRKERHV